MRRAWLEEPYVPHPLAGAMALAQQKIQEGASASAACREAASASGFAKSEIYRMLLSKKGE